MNTCSNGSPCTQTLIGLSLMAFMLATRFHHFGDALHLPDASWAIFFIAGFYLPPAWLPTLLLQAVAIDAIAIGWLGVSNYCLTPAYAALQLAHGALWLGGRALRHHALLAWSGLVALGKFGVGAGLVAFAISNGSFYWFGGRIAAPNWAEFAQTWVDYAPRFLSVMLMYLLVAAALQVAAQSLMGGKSAARKA